MKFARIFLNYRTASQRLFFLSSSPALTGVILGTQYIIIDIGLGRKKNYWGAMSSDTIAMYVWDKHDNPSFGEVLFSPIWKYIPGAKGNEYVSGGVCGYESEVFVFKLYQNEPNPFRGKTTIKYSVPVTTEVSLKVYDSCGRCVKTLAQGTRAPGNYNETLDAKDYLAGIYFAKFVAGDYKELRKLILMR